MKNSILIGSILMVFLSCTKTEDPTNFNYLIFGHYHGMCQGPNCVEYYKIQNGQLFVNTTDVYMGNAVLTQGQLEFQEYAGTEIPSGVFDLPSQFPAALYDEPWMIGTPDAYDQGGYYIEIDSDNIHKYWSIDKNRNAIPEFLHYYCDQLDYYLAIL